MDFALIVPWILGGLTVVGFLQWLKTFLKIKPNWIWGLMSLALSIGWALSPDWLRLGLGVLAISQLGYETLFKPILEWYKSRTPKVEP